MKRTVLLFALAALATLLACGAAFAASAVAFAPAKNYAAGDGARAVSTGDLDGDSDTDLVTANGGTDNVSVLIRRSDGTLKAPRKYAAGDGPIDVIAREDFNGDGARDLATASVVSDAVFVRLGRGDGTFGAQRKYAAGPGGPMAIESGDLDGDGDKDLVTANHGGGRTSDGHPDYSILGTVSVFKNKGDGTFGAARNFTAGEAFEPVDVDRSDLDGDRDEDLVVALASTRGGDGGLAVLMNNGNGAFGAPQRYDGPAYADAVIANDLDSDGDSDLAAADSNSDAVEVFKNEGAGTFVLDDYYSVGGGVGSSPASGPAGLTEADYDSDGDLDLATSNASTDNVSVLRNSGDGTFGPYQSALIFGVGDTPVDITRTRIDGDSKPDLVTANFNSDNVSVLVNTTQ